MLRYAAILLVIAIASIIIVFFGNALASVIIMIAKVLLVISLPLFVICIGIDLFKRIKKRRV